MANVTITWKSKVFGPEVNLLRDDLVFNWAVESAPLIQRAVELEAPVGPNRTVRKKRGTYNDRPDRGGRLKRSIEASVRGKSRGTSYVRVVANTPYSLLVHQGRGPVYPIRRNNLSWGENGQLIVAKRVGGTDGNRFIDRGLLSLGFKVTPKLR